MTEIKLILFIIVSLTITTSVLIFYVIYDEVKQCKNIKTIVEETHKGQNFEVFLNDDGNLMISN